MDQPRKPIWLLLPGIDFRLNWRASKQSFIQQLQQSETAPQPHVCSFIFFMTSNYHIIIICFCVQLVSCRSWLLNQDPRKHLSFFRTDIIMFTAQIRKEVNHIWGADGRMKRDNSCRCYPNLLLLLDVGIFFTFYQGYFIRTDFLMCNLLRCSIFTFLECQRYVEPLTNHLN